MVLFGEDSMDEGSEIKLKIAIDKKKHTAVFDFSDSSSFTTEVNINTPSSVVISAILYSLRSLLSLFAHPTSSKDEKEEGKEEEEEKEEAVSNLHSDIPLNQGCLFPIIVLLTKSQKDEYENNVREGKDPLLSYDLDSLIPSLTPKEASLASQKEEEEEEEEMRRNFNLLSPPPHCPIVGGNVLTSQRLCDIILHTFGVCANSQGCMNNLTFGINKSTKADGTKSFSYYETICGGAGALNGYVGQSAVHTHMTNTRITDVEILEKNYPLVLRQFHIRRDSGGEGRFRGGDGVVRQMQFLSHYNLEEEEAKGTIVSILSERRALAPQGLKGGENGKKGKNVWLRYNSAFQPPSSPPYAYVFEEEEDESGWYDVYEMKGKESVLMRPGDSIVIFTPGGGGYGEK